MKPEALHGWLTDLPPETPALVHDVGAGSGRDGACFAGKGHDVVAVEPSRSMRRIGTRLHAGVPVRWVHESLPKLQQIVRSRLSFDLILVSGLWIHISLARTPEMG